MAYLIFLLVSFLLVYCKGKYSSYVSETLNLYLVVSSDHIRNTSVCSTELDDNLWENMM